MFEFFMRNNLISQYLSRFKPEDSCVNKLHKYCVKSVRIRSYSGPYFPALRLNTERDFISLHIQSKCGKIRTRITSNTDTFYAVMIFINHLMSV